MTRSVTLVLIDGEGAMVGALPPFTVELPYWQEVAEVVTEAERRYGVTVEVLRLLLTDRPAPHGGAVTYLAEVAAGDATVTAELGAVPFDAAVLALCDADARAPYAAVGGPAASLAWARSVLRPGFVSSQQRTWNLSAIWRLESPDATCWLKQVPDFFAHEAAVLVWAGRAVPGAVPPLIAAGEAGRMLLEHVEGDDLYGASAAVREEISATAFGIQWASVGAVDELVHAGVPDRRGEKLASWICTSLVDVAGRHPAAEVLAGLLEGLEDRLAAVADCGLPDSLVHGDEHPGNAIGAEEGPVILDWGDSFVGNPAFDALRIGADLDDADAATLSTGWAQRWAVAVPGSDPLRAMELLRPVECLRLAAVYACFVANIEPTEWPYHSADITDWLDRAVQASTHDQGR